MSIEKTGERCSCCGKEITVEHDSKEAIEANEAKKYTKN